MLIKDFANINVALKKRCLISFERYSIQLIKILSMLWKKRLILGYTLEKNRVKIILKYTRGIPIIKSFKIMSKPSKKLYKKKKKYKFFKCTI
jgi:ribosomal protein S8